jgi:hypothetical protein
VLGRSAFQHIMGLVGFTPSRLESVAGTHDDAPPYAISYSRLRKKISMNISRFVINVVLTLMLAFTVNIVIWAPVAVLHSLNVLFLSTPLTIGAMICGSKLGKRIGSRREPLNNEAFCYAGIPVLTASMVASIAAFLYVLPIAAVPVTLAFGSVLVFVNALSTLLFMWLIRTPEQKRSPADADS